MTETFNPQANTVFCRKYQQELPKMPHPPFPNKKGQELQETVSEKAWKEWLEQQTMLINLIKFKYLSHIIVRRGNQFMQ